jgi:hypothetical protein
LIETFWAMVIAEGMAISPGRVTLLLVSIIVGFEPSALAATGGAVEPSLASTLKFGALEPIELTTAGRSGWSMSWISTLSNDGIELSSTWLVISRFNSAWAAMPMAPRVTRIAT